jgi:hypothetical protein
MDSSLDINLQIKNLMEAFALKKADEQEFKNFFIPE